MNTKQESSSFLIRDFFLQFCKDFKGQELSKKMIDYEELLFSKRVKSLSLTPKEKEIFLASFFKELLCENFYLLDFEKMRISMESDNEIKNPPIFRKENNQIFFSFASYDFLFLVEIKNQKGILSTTIQKM